MSDKEEIEKIYKANYMQDPFEILTEENLQRLEKHCKKAIHYERGEIKREHEITLSLLYRYLEQKQEIDKQSKIIDEMANFILDADYEKNKNSNKDYYIRCKEEVKQYFEKKVEGK